MTYEPDAIASDLDSAGSSNSAVASASDEGSTPTSNSDEASQPACPWKTDPLLAAVGVPPFERLDCGMTNSGFAVEEVTRYVDCFERGLAESQSVEFTVIDCVDCWIASTFVLAPGGRLLRLFTERDIYGDDRHESRVEACSSVEYVPEQTVRCMEPTVLFSCEGALQDALED